MANYSFTGIAGSGMSPLAQIMKLKGNRVYGSDRSFDLGENKEVKKALESLGIKIFPHDGSCVADDTDVLYASTAVEDSMPDIKAAKEKNVPIVPRFDLLAELFHQYTHNIAIGGTSGKTTTTAMVGYVLDRLGLKPCVVNGGLMQNYIDHPGVPNFIYNEGDICVIEADESNGSIEKYHPYVAVVNSIGHDHKSIEEIKEIFQGFIDRAKHAAVINLDCPHCADLKHAHKKTYTFSIKDSHADFWAYNIQPVSDGTKYSIDGKEFKLNLIGKFNVSNALACIAVCAILGIDKFDVAKALEGFLGTKRRLEVMGTSKGITVINDFAHNPEKVAASVGALKSYEGRLMILYQPHGFAPVRLNGKELAQEFANALDEKDVLVMPEIYYVGGTADTTVSSKDLIELVASQGKNALYFPTKAEAKEFILLNAKKGDRIVVMGARDPDLPELAKEILEEV